jgi:hypothetical protein
MMWSAWLLAHVLWTCSAALIIAVFTERQVYLTEASRQPHTF